MRLGIIFVLFNWLCILVAQGQSVSDSIGKIAPKSPLASIPVKGMKIKLDEQSSLKIGIGMQFWLRAGQTNPGTVNLLGDTIDRFSDMAIRRARVSLAADISKNIFFYTQFGANNQTFNYNYKPNGKTEQVPIFFHDFYGMYQIIPNGKLWLGAGVHLFNGVSRLTSVSYGRNFMLDHPGFNFPNIEHTDKAGRQMGIFAKGEINKLNYRVSIGKPFVFDERNLMADSTYRSVEIPSERFSYKGYFWYAFGESENTSTPFMWMSYLGEKKIFNIGLGFDYHPESVAKPLANGSLKKYNRSEIGIDLHWEQPLPNKSATTLYTAFYYYDFGPDYLRISGPLNLHSGGMLNGKRLAQGGGVREFSFGTGWVYYAALGYILPHRLNNGLSKLQPVAAFAFKRLDGLGADLYQYDLGFNYYLREHNLKLTAQYSARAIYNGTIGQNAIGTMYGTKGMLITQMQFLF